MWKLKLNDLTGGGIVHAAKQATMTFAKAKLDMPVFTQVLSHQLGHSLLSAISSYFLSVFFSLCIRWTPRVLLK